MAPRTSIVDVWNRRGIDIPFGLHLSVKNCQGILCTNSFFRGIIITAHFSLFVFQLAVWNWEYLQLILVLSCTGGDQNSETFGTTAMRMGSSEKKAILEFY